MILNTNYNPDVLTCLANLSNDEVFTPPQVVNRMLDMLPAELFRSKETTFLDPVSKSGVFLREIAKRLMIGLADQIPDVHERADHIFTKQLFGIAITELTALTSRRSLYCSKYANGQYSICRKFRDEDGNLRFRAIEHTFIDGKCKYCGAPQSLFGKKVRKDLESHAYEFIHTDKPERIFGKMKFDVIIGNPPYQLSRASEKTTNNGAFASAIYPLFIDKALALNPSHLIMITPSRWMTKAGQGISDAWVDKMLQSNHFVEMHDYLDASQCFPGVEIKGGVNYFLYERNYEGKCKYFLNTNDGEYSRFDYLDNVGAGIVIRDPLALKILNKITSVEGIFFTKKSFYSCVSPKHFFDKDEQLSSNWTGYSKQKDDKHNIKFFVNKRLESCGYGWIEESDIPKGHNAIPLHKVFIPKAGGSGTDQIILGKPIYGEPYSVCSYTYICIGYNQKFTKEECDNVISYINTRFFRYLVSIKKKTQDASRDVYQFVPLQDFSHPWTDEMLYEKYGLEQPEIDYIESIIRPME
jgi:site-specific DNA-methyltransferase (adenine-specific)